MQKLLSPYKRAMIICGYKVVPYVYDHGYQHFGIDIMADYKTSADRNIYASGTGVVIAAGRDNNLGYCFCINYPECVDHDGNVKNLCIKYMHCKKSYVKVGEVVTKDTLIAIEGKEGCDDFHLHFEMDTDLTNPTWTPQCKTSNFWHSGYDSTVDPSDYIYQSSDRVLIESKYNNAYLREKDKWNAVPVAKGDTVPLVDLQAIKTNLEMAMQIINDLL